MYREYFPIAGVDVDVGIDQAWHFNFNKSGVKMENDYLSFQFIFLCF